MKNKQKKALKIIDGLRSGKTLYLTVKKLSDIWNPSKTIRDWDPININLNDDTLCVLCRKSECICSEHLCKCGLLASKCEWPEGPNCPCHVCLELKSNCKCKNKFSFFDVDEDLEETEDE